MACLTLLRYTAVLLVLVRPACAFAAELAALNAAYYGAETGNTEMRLASNEEDSIRLWPGQAPGELPGYIGPEYEKCLTAGVSVAACVDLGTFNVTVPTITPHLVAGATSAVIVAPGGGYGMLAIDREGNDIATFLNSIGVSAFVLKYRVPARSWLSFGAAPLIDAQRAMGMVREMADGGKLPGLNTSKIGFMGFSAGGHLTGHLNVAWQHRTYAHVDAADDQACRPDFALMIYPWRSVAQAPVNEPISGASALNVTQSTPPTMLAQAEDDPVHVENALYYWLALKQHEVPSELHLYPKGGHGYGRCTKPGMVHGLAVCTWPDRAALFLKLLGVAPNRTAAGGPDRLSRDVIV